MRIHALQTGTVAVKTRQRRGLGSGARRRLNTFLDREWTEPLPILAWLIEHPEGPIVVDTGETARAAGPGYFPRWHPYYRTGVREWVGREDEIDRRLRMVGVPARDVRRLVLTHLHTDHAGGLHHFPESEILVSRAELEAAAGLRGRLRGYLNNRFPAWFAPTEVELEPEPVGPFAVSAAVTNAGDVRVVPTPGHSPGQLAVLVDEGERTVCLAGDVSYTDELLLEQAVDGVAPDDDSARRTLANVLALARKTPTVYLPSHDPGSAERLAERRPLPIARAPVAAVA